MPIYRRLTAWNKFQSVLKHQNQTFTKKEKSTMYRKLQENETIFDTFVRINAEEKAKTFFDQRVYPIVTAGADAEMGDAGAGAGAGAEMGDAGDDMDSEPISTIGKKREATERTSAAKKIARLAHNFAQKVRKKRDRLVEQRENLQQQAAKKRKEEEIQFRENQIQLLNNAIQLARESSVESVEAAQKAVVAAQKSSDYLAQKKKTGAKAAAAAALEANKYIQGIIEDTEDAVSRAALIKEGAQAREAELDADDMTVEEGLQEVHDERRRKALLEEGARARETELAASGMTYEQAILMQQSEQRQKEVEREEEMQKTVQTPLQPTQSKNVQGTKRQAQKDSDNLASKNMQAKKKLIYDSSPDVLEVPSVADAAVGQRSEQQGVQVAREGQVQSNHFSSETSSTPLGGFNADAGSGGGAGAAGPAVDLSGVPDMPMEDFLEDFLEDFNDTEDGVTQQERSEMPSVPVGPVQQPATEPTYFVRENKESVGPNPYRLSAKERNVTEGRYNRALNRDEISRQKRHTKFAVNRGDGVGGVEVEGSSTDGAPVGVGRTGAGEVEGPSTDGAPVETFTYIPPPATHPQRGVPTDRRQHGVSMSITPESQQVSNAYDQTVAGMTGGGVNIAEIMNKNPGQLPTANDLAQGLTVMSSKTQIAKEGHLRQQKNAQELRFEIKGMHMVYDKLIPEFKQRDHQEKLKKALRGSLREMMEHHEEMQKMIRDYYKTTDLKVGVIISADKVLSGASGGGHSISKNGKDGGDVNNIHGNSFQVMRGGLNYRATLDNRKPAYKDLTLKPSKVPTFMNRFDHPHAHVRFNKAPIPFPKLKTSLRNFSDIKNLNN